jgi:DNA-binding transcriptional ArsR family regulator
MPQIPIIYRPLGSACKVSLAAAPDYCDTVKQITEIDDPRLVKALAHPLRIDILRVLQDRVASPSEIAEEVVAPLGNVSYHVRFLARVGLLELVETRPRRGALEHYYRARGRVRITDKAWAQVPQIVKNAMVAATLGQVVRYVEAAATIGGFERADAAVSRRPMTVDKQGFTDLAAAVKQLLDRATEIEAESARRMATANHSGPEINAGLVTMLFEGPPPQAGLPAATQEGMRRSRARAGRASKRSP